MRQHAAFDPTSAYRHRSGVKGSLRRAAPALDPAAMPAIFLMLPTQILREADLFSASLELPRTWIAVGI